MERNIALKLMYNGTAYHGWQVQKNAVSVAETLEKALATVVCHPVKCHRGGPHGRRRPRRAPMSPTSAPPPPSPATGMPSGGEHPPARGHRGDARPPRCPRTSTPSAPASRRSIPTASTTPASGTPFYVNRAWFYPKHLDEDIMQRAARPVCGHPRLRRPSAPWAPRPGPPCAPSTTSTSLATPAAELIECRVCADGFLYNMVRAMVGTCRLRRRGQARPGGHPRHPGGPQPDRRRTDGAPPGGCT